MELKPKLALNILSAAILVAVLSPAIEAGTPISIENDISTAELWAAPSQVTFYLYDAIDAVNSITSQTFDANLWFSADDYTAGKTVRVSAQFTNTDMLDTASQLWVETEIDGTPVGTRHAIGAKASLPRDISVNEFIESRSAGFIFPDGSTQNTAGVTVETDPSLPAHAADVGAHHSPYTDPEAVAAIKAADGSGSGLDADLLDGQDSSAFSTAVHNHDSAYVNTAGPDAVSGSNSAAMLQATNNGTGAGLRGSSQGHHGTIGYTDANDKAGVFGNSTSGYGVWGNSENSHAVFGQSTSGRGVKGVSPAGGVYGESTQGLGVEGRSNTSDGVVGVTLASDKSGVFGSSDVGNGVTGRSGGSDGLLGVTTSSDPTDAGLHARNEGAGPAIYSEGDLYITGKSYGDVGPSEGGPFPRPAFDSGWIAVTPSTMFTLGVDQFLPTSQYDNDNFFVDMMTKSLGYAGNRYVGNGGDNWWDGTHYRIENDNSITVKLHDEYDAEVSHVRIRVWYIK